MIKMFNQMTIPFTTLTLLLVFCLPLEAASIRIGLVLPELSNAAINDIAIGAKKRAKEIGNIEILVTGTYSGEEQAKAVENYIAAGVDLIAYDSIDAAAVGPAIIKANKANIPVIGVISAASSGEMISFITPDFCENGRLIGNWMSKTLGKNGIVSHVEGNPADAAGAGALVLGFDAAGAAEDPPLPPPLPPVQPAMPAAAAVDVIARNFLRELPLFVMLSPDDIRLPSRSLN